MRATATRNDAKQDLRLPEHSPLASDAIVACECKFASTAQRIAAHCRDDETRDRCHRIESAVEGLRNYGRLCGIAILADIGASGEDSLAAGDDHCAGWVGSEFGRHIVQGSQQCL